MSTDNKKNINDKNQRSLLVAVYATAASGRGGVVAKGYNGIPIRKGEKYNLSFYTRTASSVTPRMMRIALEDSSATKVLSTVFQTTPATEWKRLSYSFTANEDADNAVLTFSTDSSTFFWLDAVSLMPENTWKNRTNGLRDDLMKKIETLHPSFIRFPGGIFAEGYTNGTFPTWKESIGDIDQRKAFWNIHGYASTNGMGFHEFLQMCEDINAEPVYVVNSGITNQKRRPRFEDITQMELLIENVLNAIAYANQPPDSLFGAMRNANGHRAPFHLKYIEIGSENFGYEYARRFNLFKQAINKAYPDITVISSSPLQSLHKNDWADQHFYGSEAFFISNTEHLRMDLQRQTPAVFIGEFSAVDKNRGTLKAAVAEACFLVRAENNPEGIMGLAYAPVLGNAAYATERSPLITFNNTKVAVSPSYHLFRMFNANRGDNLLSTQVNTFMKPHVTVGQAGIEAYGNGYEIEKLQVNNIRTEDVALLPNRQNIIAAGDSSLYNYTFTAKIRRVKDNQPIRFLVRHNGLKDDESEYIYMTFGSATSELRQQTGAINNTLAIPKAVTFEDERWYDISISCKNDTIRCFLDGSLLHEAILPPFPSLVSVATLDKTNNKIILKVVNTTHHAEKTEIHIPGMHIKRHAEIIELAGHSDERNTLENPANIIPAERIHTFPRNKGFIYNFPANSITIMKLDID